VKRPLRVAAHKAYKRARRRLGGWFLRNGGRHVVAWLSRSWRADLAGVETLDREIADRGCLIALWHGRMIVPVAQFKGRGIHVLVSPSEDGDLSERLLESFGYNVLRGSSSRGGARALREMLQILDGGGAVVITPDGPRGPMHSVNAGLAWMARATGRPIIPVGVAADRAWRLKSWDRFTIPKRRARIAVTFGDPIRVPRDVAEGEFEAATAGIREQLLEVERQSCRRIGVEPDR